MITILTLDRKKSLLRIFYYILKFIVLFFKRKYLFDLVSFKRLVDFPGHPDVLESVIIGLNHLKINYNINPKNNTSYNKIVLVISGIEALEYAIDLKKLGIIKYIFAGPNISILPSDQKIIFSDKLVNYFITPSKWVSSSYINDMKTLNNKIFEWFAGVDINYWNDNLDLKKKFVLIYIKKIKKFDIKILHYINYLKEKKIQYKIINYGSYNRKEYLKYLNMSKYSIFFSQSESQGLAIAESWSSNVPTLIMWNDHFYYKNKKIYSSTSPYLSSETGQFFESYDDFKMKIDYFELNYKKFIARKWVINNMSNILTTKNLIASIIKKIIILDKNFNIKPLNDSLNERK